MVGGLRRGVALGGTTEEDGFRARESVTGDQESYFQAISLASACVKLVGHPGEITGCLPVPPTPQQP